MTSVVFHCNLALGNVGKPVIEDINGGGAEAKACKLYYDHVRNILVQAYPWRWSLKSEALAEVTNTKANKWIYAYKRPSNCLKLWKVTDENFPDYLPYDAEAVKAGGYKHEVEGNTIYCNVSPAYLVFGSKTRADDPTIYPPLFSEAFGWHLATRIAMPLTRDAKVRKTCFDMALQMQAEAAAADANEVRETSDTSCEWIEARA